MLRGALARASLSAPRGLAQRGIIAAPRGLLARALSTAPPAAAAANTGAIVEIASAADFETLVMKASTQAPPVGGPGLLQPPIQFVQLRVRHTLLSVPSNQARPLALKPSPSSVR